MVCQELIPPIKVKWWFINPRVSVIYFFKHPSSNFTVMENHYDNENDIELNWFPWTYQLAHMPYEKSNRKVTFHISFLYNPGWTFQQSPNKIEK